MDTFSQGSVRSLLAASCALAAITALSACGGSSGDDGAPSNSTAGHGGAGSAGPSTAAGPSGGAESHTGVVSKSEAGHIVTGRYGGHVLSIESDTEHGRATWEVEVRDSHRGRIEVDVAKADGSIAAVEHED